MCVWTARIKLVKWPIGCRPCARYGVEQLLMVCKMALKVKFSSESGFGFDTMVDSPKVRIGDAGVAQFVRAPAERAAGSLDSKVIAPRRVPLRQLLHKHTVILHIFVEVSTEEAMKWRLECRNCGKQ